MLLTNYAAVPSGLSFEFDTGPTVPRKAALLSTPGMAAVLTIGGSGIWTAELLASNDGINFLPIALKSTPGQWRFETRGVSAVAVRLATHTAGSPIGSLSHGGALPVTTNVSALFGSYLVFSFNATPTEPPTGNQIRFNNAALPQVTKIWIRNTTNDGTDQFQSLRRIPHGGTLLVQDRDDHTHAALFSIVGPPIDKGGGTYVEVPVVYQEHIGALASALTLVAVFNPGPTVSLNPVMITTLPARTPPTLTALLPAAMPLGGPSFTLRVKGTGFLPGDTILWNGSPEPTTYVLSSELITGVNMETAQVVMPIPVAVQTAEGLLSVNTLTFDLGGTPGSDEGGDG